jgi:hypothetical protein
MQHSTLHDGRCNGCKQKGFTRRRDRRDVATRRRSAPPARASRAASLRTARAFTCTHFLFTWWPVGPIFDPDSAKRLSPAHLYVVSVRPVRAPLDASGVRVRAAARRCSLFAAAPVRAGALVGVYAGEPLTAAAFAARYPEGGERKPSYCYHQRADLIIDASDAARSSVLRFVNSPHGTHLRANVRFAAKAEVRAARAIKAGEELLLSYGRGYKW